MPDAGTDDPPADRRFFAARDGVLVITDAGGSVTWDGSVGGGFVLDAISVGDQLHGLVLLDWEKRPPGVEAWHPFLNVLKVDGAGHEVWCAEVPPSETQGSYTGIKVDAGRLIAFGWAGYAILDAQDGHVSDYVFTK